MFAATLHLPKGIFILNGIIKRDLFVSLDILHGHKHDPPLDPCVRVARVVYEIERVVSERVNPSMSPNAYPSRADP